MAVTRGYNAAQITLHWLVAALVTFNYFYSDGMGRALAARLRGTESTRVAIEPWVHVWVGVAVLALVLLRLVLRWRRGAPAAPGSGFLQRAAEWGHRALYLLLVITPVLGALAWFGGVRSLGDPHEVVANLLLIAAGGHAVMALFHHYVLNDGLLRRMLRPE